MLKLFPNIKWQKNKNHRGENQKPNSLERKGRKLKKSVKLRRTNLKLISGIITFIFLLIAIFPELRVPLVNKIYNVFGLDKPNIVFENTDLDDMAGIFDGCPIGFYLDTQNISNSSDISQSFIYFNSKHDLRFSLRNTNKITDDKIIINNIIFIVKDYITTKQYPFKIGGECGAGETEKIYSVDGEILKSKLEQGYKNFQIDANIDQLNKESFDFTTLSSENNIDFYKLKIPMLINGVIKFQVKAIVSYKNNNYDVLSSEYYIGNIENADWYF